MDNNDKGSTTANTEIAHSSPLVWGKNGEWWDTFLIWSLIGAAVAAAVVVCSTAGSILAHKREGEASERELNKYKLETEGKVADAKSEGIAAGKTAGDALVRAAQLQKEAELARLETEKIKKTVAWRTLTPEQAKKFEETLAKNPGDVNLRYTDGDAEALFLAIQIGNLLTAAKWNVAPGSEKANGLVFGIAIPDGEGAPALREAFDAVHIPYGTQQPPTAGAQFNVSTIPGAPTLFVGSRPTTFN